MGLVILIISSSIYDKKSFSQAEEQNVCNWLAQENYF